MREEAEKRAREEEERKGVEERERREKDGKRDDCLERKGVQKDRNAANWIENNYTGRDLELKNRVDAWRLGVIADQY